MPAKPPLPFGQPRRYCAARRSWPTGCVSRGALLVPAVWILAAGSCWASQPTITFWSKWYGSAAQDWVKNVAIPAFERQYGVKVEYRHVQEEDAFIAAVAGGVAPDIYIGGSEETLLDLRPFLRNWPDQRQIPPALWRAATDPRTGAIIRVPQEVEIRGIAYNPRLFSEAGLEPYVPQDWDSFLSAVRKLTRKQGERYVQSGFRWSFLTETGLAGTDLGWFLVAAGGDFTTPDERTSTIDSAAMRRTLTFLADLFEIVGENSPGTGFNNNNVAMTRGQPSVPRSYYAANPDAKLGTIGVAPLRSGPQLPPTALAPVNGLGIVKTSKNPQLAWQFITFLLSADMQAQFALYKERQIVRRDVAVRTDLEPMRIWRDWYALMDYVIRPGRLEKRSQISPFFAAVYKKEMSVEVAIANAARIHQAALTEYWTKQ